MFRTCLAIAAVLAIDDVAASQQQATQGQAEKREQPRRKGLSERDKAEVEALIDQLALREDEMGAETFREASQRIAKVAGHLRAFGRPAWDTLFENAKDGRASAIPRAYEGTFSVGAYCREIIFSQVVSHPRGYIYHRGDYYLNQKVFKPSLQEWLEARRDVPLKKIQAELLQHVIDYEAGEDDLDPEIKQEGLTALRSRLRELRDE